MATNYQKFIEAKSQIGTMDGFEPIWVPDFLFDFQQLLVSWAIRKGKSAIFADCGLGKTPMQLVWAENITRQTNGRVLILTPLAVSSQTIREAGKFGIEAAKCIDGALPKEKIIVANYQRLHYFKPSDFVGAVCDESSILKNFDGAIKTEVTEFMRKMKYRLLCTATAAPNDFIELGTSSEALGELGYIDMLGRFFKHDSGSTNPGRRFFAGKWRFRGHAERDFWRWVCSWARAVRKPSDLGCEDGMFVLPPLSTIQHIVKAKTRPEGFLFEMPAMTLEEQRDERRRTIQERCVKAAELALSHPVSVLWCHLNPEGDLLAKLVKDSVQVSGDDSDERKEEVFEAFQSGQAKRLVTKPTIAGWGSTGSTATTKPFSHRIRSSNGISRSEGPGGSARRSP